MQRLWTIHLATLVVLAVWPAIDPWFETMIRARSISEATEIAGWIRACLLCTCLVISVTSLITLFIQLFGRIQDTVQSRSLGQLFAITTVIAIWCSLALHHHAIAWQGKRARFAYRIDELEAIAAPLRGSWPERDGNLTTIGPFMAYPFGQPTTLVLLQAPRVASQSVYVSAIERCPSGAIKLQLTGTDGGDWAEWHPPTSRPKSFVGGLADLHEIRLATAIGSGWYLVRYQA